MERRHYQRIRAKAIEAANAGVEPKPDRSKPMLIGAAILVACLLLWGFVRHVMPDTELEDGTGAAAADSANGGGGEAGFDGLLTTEVEALAQRFLEADSVEALLEIVEQPEISEPRMREFYADPELRPLPMGGQMVALARLEMEGERVYGMLVDGMFATRSLIPIMEDEEGKPTLRWEWAVGWMDPKWEEVLAERPEQPTTVKVLANLDDYYNYEYRDASKWQCLRLAGRDMETFCYAYIDRSASGIEQLAGLEAAAPMRLTIKFAPEAKPNQAEVVEFHHIGWMGD